MRQFTVLEALIAGVLAALLASVSSQAQTQGRWVFRDLGIGEARDINRLGNIVGNSRAGRATLWQNGRTIDLGTMGGDSSWA